ncbi:MAG: leucine-rich repeat protein [Muribaculaceae bacterium]|nr:leucine-rich repeat protein [Muribaculaceae bacterium]
MKNFITSTLLLLALLLPATATAYDFEVDGIYYNINGNEATVTKGDADYVGDVTIPSTVTYRNKTYPVTAIGDGAFYFCTGMTGVTIPNSVYAIGFEAFYGCSRLTDVIIPNSVTTIGEVAFWGCTSLTSITIPNSVTIIGNGAFYNTAWYNNQSDGLIYAGLVAYNYKGTMPTNTNITLRDGTVSIASNAFEYCTGLTSISIPNSVTTIGDYAFSSCTGLASVTIPNSVTTIGRNAFAGCRSLTNVDIPNSVTSIYAGTFSDCSGLTNVNIPNSITTIGGGAFANCSGLTSVTIPNSVTTIGGEAFKYCNSLKHVFCYITDPSAITMGDDVFRQQDQDISGRILHVPNGTADAYQADWHWFPFFEMIVEMGHVYGDVNGDDEVNIADVNVVIDVVLGGDNAAADVNGDGEVNIADVNTVIDVILRDYNALDITGGWYSEYAVDEYGRYDIPEEIAVYFTFYRNKTGYYSYTGNEGIDELIALRWKLEGQRLYIWYNDGDYEELYCTIDENGYLLLSLDEDFKNYTAYRRIWHRNNAAIDRKAQRQDNGSSVIKSVSRAIKERIKTED